MTTMNSFQGMPRSRPLILPALLLQMLLLLTPWIQGKMVGSDTLIFFPGYSQWKSGKWISISINRHRFLRSSSRTSWLANFTPLWRFEIRLQYNPGRWLGNVAAFFTLPTSKRTQFFVREWNCLYTWISINPNPFQLDDLDGIVLHQDHVKGQSGHQELRREESWKTPESVQLQSKGKTNVVFQVVHYQHEIWGCQTKWFYKNLRDITRHQECHTYDCWSRNQGMNGNPDSGPQSVVISWMVFTTSGSLIFRWSCNDKNRANELHHQQPFAFFVINCIIVARGNPVFVAPRQMQSIMPILCKNLSRRIFHSGLPSWSLNLFNARMPRLPIVISVCKVQRRGCVRLLVFFFQPFFRRLKPRMWLKS